LPLPPGGRLRVLAQCRVCWALPTRVFLIEDVLGCRSRRVAAQFAATCARPVGVLRGRGSGTRRGSYTALLLVPEPVSVERTDASL